MNGIKGLFSSKTVWGGLIAILAPIVGGIFHVTVTGDDVQQVGDYVSGIASGLGGLWAIYGRIVATKLIG